MQSLNQTQFKYADKIYTFIARLQSLKDYTTDLDKNLNEVSLYTNSIESFEYVNEANNLFLTGEMVYIDQFGAIDRFIDQPNVILNILFAENDQEFDGTFAIDDLSEKNRFAHAFVVNNIQILERNARRIKYKLKLIDINIYKLMRNISFSNYDKDPEEIFDIIKACFAKSELTIDKTTFDAVKSSVKLNYITNGNDCVLSIVPFLMNKVYYSDDKDSSVKLVCFDHTNDRFFLLNIADQNTFLGCSQVMLSFFNNNTEALSKARPANFSTVTKTTALETLVSEFSNNMIGYDMTTNEFTSMSYTSQNIMNYANASQDGTNYKKKFTPDMDEPLHFKRSSFWNNDNDVYHKIVDTLCQNNALIINTDGDILRQPGYFCNLNVDRDAADVQSDDTDEKADIKNRYKMFDGIWSILKVRNIVKPATQEFTQNLIVGRNFINKSNIASN